MVHVDAPGLPQNGEAAPGIGVQPGIEHGVYAAAIPQQRRVGGIHPGLRVKAAEHPQFLRVLSQEIGRQADVIAGHVIGRAAAQPLLIAVALGIGVKGGVLRLQIADTSDLAAVHQLLYLLHQLGVAVGVSLLQQDMVPVGGVKHLPDLRLVQGQGLFAEDVLSGLRRLQHPLPMDAVGQGNVHRVHVLIVQQGLVIGIKLLRGEGLRVSAQLLFVPPRDGVKLRVSGAQQAGNRPALSDAGTAENSPAHDLVLHWSAILSHT